MESPGLVPRYVDECPNCEPHALEETHIPAKHEELIGRAIAANVECPYCQLFHREAAKVHDATPVEVARYGFLASRTSRCRALVHARNYDYVTFQTEFVHIADRLQERTAAGD